MARLVEIAIEVARLPRLAFGGITARLPAAASGSMTRWSASNALSAINISACIVGQEVVGTDQVVRLAAGQMEADRIAERIDQSMDLGAQSAARAPDRLVLAGFFWAPALC